MGIFWGVHVCVLRASALCHVHTRALCAPGRRASTWVSSSCVVHPRGQICRWVWRAGTCDPQQQVARGPCGLGSHPLQGQVSAQHLEMRLCCGPHPCPTQAWCLGARFKAVSHVGQDALESSVSLPPR